MHLETLSNINSETHYYLHRQLRNIGTESYIATGKIDKGFINCLENVVDERNACGTDKEYFLVLHSSSIYYYSIRTIKDKIVRISPMRKADVGFKGGGAMYRASCDLKLLLQTSSE
ncbi:hypothetical protein [Pseudoalteromonas ulvae]|uniref:hypothetical protein n=1 Tax=Pseudoalteromonas ulvae TaxID=107327 RepID=UPI00186B6397|nr:hypothetical protein [Pseudoalteromonas ulvae]